jgi:hypothetical protein
VDLDAEGNKWNFGEGLIPFLNKIVYLILGYQSNNHSSWKMQTRNIGIIPTVKDNKKNSGRYMCTTSGAFGIHLLGYTTEGIIWLVISLVTCGTVTALLG